MLLYLIKYNTGERPFVCYQCSKTFVSRGSLNSHLRTHEGTRLYQCGDCQMMFTTAGSVRRHMAVHQVDAIPSLVSSTLKTLEMYVLESPLSHLLTLWSCLSVYVYSVMSGDILYRDCG